MRTCIFEQPVSCKNLNIHDWQVEQVAVGVHQIFTVAADVCNYPVWAGNGIRKLLPMIIYMLCVTPKHVFTLTTCIENSKLTLIKRILSRLLLYKCTTALTGRAQISTRYL